MNPQFNREGFAEQLRENGIAYIYLGTELGGRTEDPGCYEGKRVRYDRLAQKDVLRVDYRGSSRAQPNTAFVCCARKKIRWNATVRCWYRVTWWTLGRKSDISSQMVDSRVMKARSNVC